MAQSGNNLQSSRYRQLDVAKKVRKSYELFAMKERRRDCSESIPDKTQYDRASLELRGKKESFGKQQASTRSSLSASLPLALITDSLKRILGAVEIALEGRKRTARMATSLINETTPIRLATAWPRSLAMRHHGTLRSLPTSRRLNYHRVLRET